MKSQAGAAGQSGSWMPESFKYPGLPFTDESGTSASLCLPILRLQFAGFAAGRAIILAVFTEPDIVLALAQPAEFFALAAALRLLANTTGIFFCHERRLPRFRGLGNGSYVSGGC